MKRKDMRLYLETNKGDKVKRTTKETLSTIGAILCGAAICGMFYILYILAYALM